MTIPLAVRQALGLEAGSTINFVVEADGRVVLEMVRRSVTPLQGVLRRDGPVLSAAAMKEVVQEGALRRSAHPDFNAG